MDSITILTKQISGWRRDKRFNLESTWIRNQADFKPYDPFDFPQYSDDPYQYGYSDPVLTCVYAYNPDHSFDQRIFLDIFGPLPDRVVVNPYESLAYVARSRTGALGLSH